MSYLVLARKYRPRTFEEVAGQPAAAQTLKNALELGRIAHAYLFAGPRGVGKTSMARILARSLCCERGPTVTPCGTCDRCTSILRGADLDVVEIDAASNRGIDDIRSLRDKARAAPMRGKTKFYIIDEVHQLTSEAFNALLKILEEPPAHVLFVLATTEAEKIPDTIRSRCQFFEFRRVPEREIAERLDQVCAAENVKAEKSALEAIARAARGGMRDAQSLLDQVITHDGGTVTLAGVMAVTGSLSSDIVLGLLDAVVRGDHSFLLGEVERLDRGGIAAEGIIDALLAEVREIMILCAAGSKSDLVADDDRGMRLRELAAVIDLDRALVLVNVLLAARRRVGDHDEPRLPLEAALLRMARVTDTMPIGEAVAAIRDGIAIQPHSPVVSGSPRGGSGSARRAPPSERSADPAVSPPAAPRVSPDPTPSPGPTSRSADASTSPISPLERFERIVAAVAARHGAVATILKTHDVVGGDDARIEIRPRPGVRVPPGYNIDGPKMRQIVADAAVRLFGHAVVLTAAAPAPPAGPAAPGAADPPPRASGKIDRVRKMFDGEVV